MDRFGFNAQSAIWMAKKAAKGLFYIGLFCLADKVIESFIVGGKYTWGNYFEATDVAVVLSTLILILLIALTINYDFNERDRLANFDLEFLRNSFLLQHWKEIGIILILGWISGVSCEFIEQAVLIVGIVISIKRLIDSEPFGHGLPIRRRLKKRMIGF